MCFIDMHRGHPQNAYLRTADPLSLTWVNVEMICPTTLTLRKRVLCKMRKDLAPATRLSVRHPRDLMGQLGIGMLAQTIAAPRRILPPDKREGKNAIEGAR